MVVENLVFLEKSEDFCFSGFFGGLVAHNTLLQLSALQLQVLHIAQLDRQLLVLHRLLQHGGVGLVIVNFQLFVLRLQILEGFLEVLDFVLVVELLIPELVSFGKDFLFDLDVSLFFVVEFDVLDFFDVGFVELVVVVAVFLEFLSVDVELFDEALVFGEDETDLLFERVEAVLEFGVLRK